MSSQFKTLNQLVSFLGIFQMFLICCILYNSKMIEDSLFRIQIIVLQVLAPHFLHRPRCAFQQLLLEEFTSHICLKYSVPFICPLLFSPSHCQCLMRSQLPQWSPARFPHYKQPSYKSQLMLEPLSPSCKGYVHFKMVGKQGLGFEQKELLCAFAVYKLICA